VLVSCTLLAAGSLAVSLARAQDRDDAWVISQIAAGKFDELRSLEALSAQVVPFAMYWWGAMLERCIFERCNKGAARELILRAAVAGSGRAKAHVLGGAETREEFDQIVAKIGIPTGGQERVVYVGRNLLFIQMPPALGGAPRASDAKLRADLLAMAKSELQIGIRAIVAQLQGPTSTDLDVLAETGNDIFSEPLMQRL
jgi:formate-dependent phosphoribosylglycinamide formyltransferase (GAR transformylase)